MSHPSTQPPDAEDPLDLISRARTWLHTRWLRSTYPFAEFGARTSINHTCEIPRSSARAIAFAEHVYLARDCWLNVTEGAYGPRPKIVIGRDCRIGRRATISARNHIALEEDVLFAPSVLLMDHNHAFADINTPIHAQGVTAGGTIRIGRGCWLGTNAVVLSGDKDLVIGRNSVIGANAVVTQSFPDYSVIVGNPAKLLKVYEPEVGAWVKPGELRPTPSYK